MLSHKAARVLASVEMSKLFYGFVQPGCLCLPRLGLDAIQPRGRFGHSYTSRTLSSIIAKKHESQHRSALFRLLCSSVFVFESSIIQYQAMVAEMPQKWAFVFKQITGKKKTGGVSPACANAPMANLNKLYYTPGTSTDLISTAVISRGTTVLTH